MLFPESPRVSYERNPLEQVICQLRFPAILRIATQPPAAFQDAIRGQFPVLQQRKEVLVELPAELPAELAKRLPAELFTGSADVAYDFSSADEISTLTLAKDFIALTCREYARWEAFREQLAGALVALQREYQPAFLQRVGLRYRNIIERSSLGFPGDYPWRELLQPAIAGPLQREEVVGAVRSLAQECHFTRDPTEQAKVRYGLVRPKNSDELCFLIDADFFTEERVPCEQAIDILDDFNVDAGRLFRWCIQERLHDALGPRPLE
jgi:uncharacterized protein (TIGR04255 family)